MSQSQFQAEKPAASKQRSAQHGGVPGDDKGRKFFQQMQPTFSIELENARTTELEFLDHSDPRKSIVVRKKAREWVNKNKELSKQNRGGKSQSNSKNLVFINTNAGEPKKAVAKRRIHEGISLDALQPVSLNEFDPFKLLPSVGRKYDHIIQFFLTACPEEIPCSDDKYSQTSLVQFSSENTVLGNMAKSELTFILWLYATSAIRDVITLGTVDTEEVRWFCNKTLKAMQDAVKYAMEHEEYPENLIVAITCITATASISGMFKAAGLHRDALVRILELRGKGSIVTALQSLSPWSVKAIQWCEFLVCMQNVEIPKVPYLAQLTTASVPQKVLDEVARLTTLGLNRLPPLSLHIRSIFHLLHVVGTAYAQPKGETKIDSYIIQPLYDAEYSILTFLSAQKVPDYQASDIEVVLAETFQLYFWACPRQMMSRSKNSALMVARIMKALLPLLLEEDLDLGAKEGEEAAASIIKAFYPSLPRVPNWFYRPELHSEGTNNIIAWSLATTAVHTAPMASPEHAWFMEHLRLHAQAMGLDQDEERYRQLMDTFPNTDGFPRMNVKALFGQLRK